MLAGYFFYLSYYSETYYIPENTGKYMSKVGLIYETDKEKENRYYIIS